MAPGRPSYESQCTQPYWRFSLTWSCWNCKDNPCHVGEKRKLAFVHLPPKQLGDSTVCIWQQFVAAPLLFKLALRRNLAYEISALPYLRVLDYSTFEFTTLPYPTRSWKTTTRWGLPMSCVFLSSLHFHQASAKYRSFFRIKISQLLESLQSDTAQNVKEVDSSFSSYSLSVLFTDFQQMPNRIDIF